MTEPTEADNWREVAEMWRLVAIALHAENDDSGTDARTAYHHARNGRVDEAVRFAKAVIGVAS